ncbi:MAG: oligopeptide transporter, OPT family [Acidobacteria bacterium]|nr:oligopeptide transporter, OPT family [Acidobacteriota bacterium]
MNQHKPLVGADRHLPEFTVKGFVLGAVLSMLLAFANAYIGLLVGLTVSASIPAAAISMGSLRAFKRSNILENNMVQTSASAGESLVAGMIFTIPALVMMGAWDSYLYGPMVGIAIVGGVMGVAFTIPLRKALIVQAQLKFPEGVATAEVLKVGGIEVDRDHPEKQATDEGKKGFLSLVEATVIGGIFKLLEAGVGLFQGNVATVKSLFSGRYLFQGDVSISPALIGVGFIVGLNIATLVFLGGVIGTLIGVPVNWAMNHDGLMAAAGLDPQASWSSLTSADWGAVANASWQNCRRIGVGAMMVGGVWSLISLAKPLIDGVKVSLAAYRNASSNADAIERTDYDIPINYVAWAAGLGSIPVFMIFNSALQDYPNKMMIALLMTVLMLIFGFIFSSVAGYMAGLVGSSNNPISGVTIATVIVSALILSAVMGVDGPAAKIGPIAVLYLAGLICSAAAIAGDNMQDLKCGHIVGSTPWRQQIYQVVGVIAAATVIPIALSILDKGQGIGRPIVEGGSFLAAPQAGLMRDIATGIFGGGEMHWGFIYIGFGLAVLLIIVDKFQERSGASFRFPILAVAVGVYLPFGLSLTIFVGGVLAHYVKRATSNANEKQQRTAENTGLLLASGLITGEALMGVLVALGAVFHVTMSINPPGAALFALIALTAVVVYLIVRTLRAARA